jgi:hypothetical protein
MGRRDGTCLVLAAAVIAAMLVAFACAAPLQDESRLDAPWAQSGRSRGLAPVLRQNARNSTAAAQGPPQAPVTKAVPTTSNQTDKSRVATAGSTRGLPSNSTAPESTVDQAPGVNSTTSEVPADQGSQLANNTSESAPVPESPIASPAQSDGQNGSSSSPRKETRGPVIRNVSVLVGIVFAAIAIAAVPLAFCFFCGCCRIEKAPKEIEDFESADSRMLADKKRLSRSSVRKSLDCSAVLAHNGIPKSMGHRSEAGDFSLSSDYTDSRSGSLQGN